jgi:pimeloyl-ACP methyl ester carboxylesterase
MENAMSKEVIETTQPEKYTHANGIAIYCEVFGSGQTVIFLHGSMGTGEVWKPYIPILSQNFNLILPDARGHGKTQNPDGEINLHLLAEDLAALIDNLELNQPVLCGWSMGGDIGLDLAIRYPNKVSGLIVGGVTHRISENYFASLKTMGLDEPGQINFERAEENIPQLVALWKTVHTQNPDHWKELVTQLSYEMWDPKLSSEDDLKQITVPTLIVWGDRDQFLPVENALALYRLIPNAQLAVVPNPDHFVTRTKTAVFADLVENFISSSEYR